MLPLSTARLDRLARRLERDAEVGLIPGAQLVVGRRDGIAYEAAVGWRDASARDPLRADAVWRIFSMTKPLVTAAAMTFVEEGALRLDGPVADLIPAFADLRVATPDGDTAAGGSTAPAVAAPTVQDLMRHTAGIAYGPLGGGPAARALARDGFLGEDLPLVDYVERLAALPLEFEPGTVWHYSHATDVLGRVIEIVGGGTLGAVLRERILGPLGMAETGFLLPGPDRARVAEPLFPQPPGARPRFFDPCAPRRHESGGGGLVSTAADYARFCRMVLGRGTLDGARVLAPATVALMAADHLGRGIGRAAWYPPGPGYGFGLGFAVRTAAGEAPYPGSVGDLHWNGVGGTSFWIDPAQDLFAMVMLQTSSAEQRQHYRMLARAMVYAALG